MVHAAKNEALPQSHAARPFAEYEDRAQWTHMQHAHTLVQDNFDLSTNTVIILFTKSYVQS